MYPGIHVKYPLFLSDFNETWLFSTDGRKILISKFVKTLPMEAELFCEEGQTDRQTDRHDEANSRFSQFRQSANRNIFIMYQAANVAIRIGSCEFPTEGWRLWFEISPFVDRNITTCPSKYHQVSVEISPRISRNITTWQSKYHYLSVEISPCVSRNITNCRSKYHHVSVEISPIVGRNVTTCQSKYHHVSVLVTEEWTVNRRPVTVLQWQLNLWLIYSFISLIGPSRE